MISYSFVTHVAIVSSWKHSDRLTLVIYDHSCLHITSYHLTVLV